MMMKHVSSENETGKSILARQCNLYQHEQESNIRQCHWEERNLDKAESAVIIEGNHENVNSIVFHHCCGLKALITYFVCERFDHFVENDTDVRKCILEANDKVGLIGEYNCDAHEITVIAEGDCNQETVVKD
jgi:hypothetical protein